MYTYTYVLMVSFKICFFLHLLVSLEIARSLAIFNFPGFRQSFFPGFNRHACSGSRSLCVQGHAAPGPFFQHLQGSFDIVKS